MTHTIKYYSRDTGALIAIKTDVEERKAKNMSYDYGDYWTTTIEPWPFTNLSFPPAIVPYFRRKRDSP